MQKRHSFLDRNALLVLACSRPLTSADSALLAAHGIGSSVLGPAPPAWLAKWAALTLGYIVVSIQAGLAGHCPSVEDMSLPAEPSRNASDSDDDSE